MISRLGLAISRVFERSAPDPFVIAILLTILTAILALIFGQFPVNDKSILDRLEFCWTRGGSMRCATTHRHLETAGVLDADVSDPRHRPRAGGNAAGPAP